MLFITLFFLKYQFIELIDKGFNYKSALSIVQKLRMNKESECCNSVLQLDVIT